MFGKDKEEKPDELAGNSEVKTSHPMPGEPGSENLHYRLVTVDKDTEEDGRYDRHRYELGYEVVKKRGRQVLMCCDPKAQAKRSKASAKLSADAVTEPARHAQQNHVQSGSNRPLETIEVGRGPASELYPDD